MVAACEFIASPSPTMSSGTVYADFVFSFIYKEKRCLEGNLAVKVNEMDVSFRPNHIGPSERPF
jgi:hypothetical protein